MQLRTVGPAGLLLDCADGAEAESWYAALRQAREAGELRCADLVPAATTVLIAGLAERSVNQVADWLGSDAIDPAPATNEAGNPPVTLTVRYDGPDLGRVAELWGVAEAEVIHRHTELAHRVLFCGFAPGFSYLAGLPDEWRVPRLEAPRSSVPAGAVGLAGGWTGIYPRSSPGGWQLIGTLVSSGSSGPPVLFDPDRDPPALLPPGTSVRFRAEQ
jgi:allophanate hydrolase subunit 1